MNDKERNTDVSRLRNTEAVKDSAETSSQPAGCAAVEKATVLLVHGMQQSELPISKLSGALARMAQILNDNGAPLFGEVVTHRATDLKVVRDAFASDIAICIESVQFHDRLMQQLKQARDILTGLATDRLPPGFPAEPANEGSVELF
jgi:hypothetical protein